MKVIEALNVNDAVAQALPYLLTEGLQEDSRNGKVLVAPGPVTTVYLNPVQRVLFSPLRDANPFFHLMESLWMLAGKNNLDFPAAFNARFKGYSDDSETIHGAYGYRWRTMFTFDQLEVLIEELLRNPNTRRAVLTMWSPMGDLIMVNGVGGPDSKDVPCNTHAYFDLRGGKLNMTVLCRSNDVVWGAYGANAVHFSFLLEYMAGRLGAPVGIYRQVSNNFHAYTDIYDEAALRRISDEARISNYYEGKLSSLAVSFPLFFGTSPEDFEVDIMSLMSLDLPAFKTPFFKKIVHPMFDAWTSRKTKASSGRSWIEMMPPCDWKLASLGWIDRRKAAFDKENEASQDKELQSGSDTKD